MHVGGLSLSVVTAETTDGRFLKLIRVLTVAMEKQSQKQNLCYCLGTA